MTETMHPSPHLGNPARETNTRLALSLGLTLAFVVLETLAGFLANSLALLTDAAHNLTDVIALALTWHALRLTEKPASASKTFGNHRTGIIVALINSTSLVLISLGVFYEAYRRLSAPPEVRSNILIAVGVVAFGVNLATALLVRRGSDRDLNLRSAFVHLMGDVLSTLGAITAGIAIALTGWNWLDPLVSLLIGLLILWNAVGILRESVNILLENTPRDVDLDALLADILKVEGVRGVHDLHVWSLTRSLRSMSAHIVTDDTPISSGVAIQVQISELARHRYHITHATLQLECEDCNPNLLYCDLNDAPRQGGSLAS